MAKKTIKVPVLNLSGEKVEDLSLDGNVFGIEEKNTQVVHQAILTQLANARQMTAKTKKRHEVSGGGKKPYRQKGTGRARAGSTRSPIWVGGGTVFGPDGNQDYTLYQNKKAHQLALKTVLSEKVKDGLVVVDNLSLDQISSKQMSKVLINLKAEGKILLVNSSENVTKSARNIANITLRDLNNISVYDVVNASRVIISKDDIKTLEGGLK